MKVLYKGVGKPVKSLIIEEKLEDMQKLVGGHIEAVQLTEDIVMVCNEEGWLHGLEPNFVLWGSPVAGNVFFCGSDGEHFADCPVDENGIIRLLEAIEW